MRQTGGFGNSNAGNVHEGTFPRGKRQRKIACFRGKAADRAVSQLGNNAFRDLVPARPGNVATPIRRERCTVHARIVACACTRTCRRAVTGLRGAAGGGRSERRNGEGRDTQGKVGWEEKRGNVCEPRSGMSETGSLCTTIARRDERTTSPFPPVRQSRIRCSRAAVKATRLPRNSSRRFRAGKLTERTCSRSNQPRPASVFL